VKTRLKPKLWSQLVDLVYPPRCEVCGADGPDAFCGECLKRVTTIEHPYCRRCNVPFPGGQEERWLCGDCQHAQSPLVAARSVGLHTGPLREAVSRLKFHGARRLAPVLAELIYDRVLREADEPDGLSVGDIAALVPAVLHSRRRRWRGFDQSLELAKALGEMWRIPVLDALERVHDTKPQVGLSADERQKNMAGAFRVRVGAEVAGLVVAVVDDVWTTGSTLGACARALQRGRASRVYGLTVTRTPPPWHEAAAEKYAIDGA
jgi:ComF family protein